MQKTVSEVDFACCHNDIIFTGNVFYLKLDVKLGLTMVVLTGALLYLAQPLAQSATWVWLSASIGIFVGGWILQFIGHHFEGKKPAFVDDIMGLAIGPLFVVAELGFELGESLRSQKPPKRFLTTW